VIQQNIKLIIFDVGGVVYDRTSIGKFVAKDLDISYRKFLQYAQFCGLQGLQKGLVTEERFLDDFSRLMQRKIYADLWTRFFSPLPIKETVELINELKLRFRLVAGTNTIRPHFDIHTKHGDYEIFPKVYASHEIKLAKPDPGFYAYILQSERVKPNEALLIDDSPVNVQSAIDFGLHAFRFTDGKSLRQSLNALL
jgi:putative hydrolase of the HAD superfamily